MPVNRDDGDPPNDKPNRCARLHGLSFHIDESGFLCEHAGYKSEDREANEYELEMWNHLMAMTPDD